MGRTENIKIFEDTLHLCRSDSDLVSAIQEINKKQEIILESDFVPTASPRFNSPAKIIVSRKRSFEAAREYFLDFPCVLNFASATNPGGGVVWGSTAQEECLCRCSTLYSNLTSKPVWTPFYERHRAQGDPLYNDDCIYTPEVVVFKTDTREPELMHKEDWWWANVITCAAPNLRPGRDGKQRTHINDKELYNLHVKRMRRILSIAAMKGNTVIILGAYGCGAFRNPPGVVSSAMRQVIQEFRYCFHTIEFAIYCSPRDEQNYLVFQQVLGGLN